MQARPNPDNRFARPAFIAVCLGLLMIPLFFISQISLQLIGLPELNVFGDEGQNILVNSPAFSLVAPFLRAILLILTLVGIWRRSRWVTYTFLAAVLIHLVSWMMVLANSYFTLPTGYLTLALGGTGLYLLLCYPELRGGRD